MRDSDKTMRIGATISWLLMTSLCRPPLPVSATRDNSETSEVVCGSMEVRNSVYEFQKLQNCTVVEGHLHIVLHESDRDSAAFKDVSLPRLREITDYLLLYRVKYLKTLSNIFPNLSVIRGRQLFFNYALVVFEMYSLEDLGLSNLMLIERGAVLIDNNPQLCYLDTVDWNRILETKLQSYLLRNKKTDDCVTFYPQKIEGCTATTSITLTDGQVINMPLCWNFDKCQKICPSSCSSGACYEVGLNNGSGGAVSSSSSSSQRMLCCHSECVGGCSGPTDAECFACKGIKHEGRCMRSCPHGTFEVQRRRCLSRTECEEFHNGNPKLSSWKAFTEDGKNLCLRECPSGYVENASNRHQCVQCSGPCPKECVGRIVDNIQAAQMLEGCTLINGILEIQIQGGNVMELEKYLGQIQEVADYLRVIDSYALTDLHFLKSLRVIRGRRLYSGLYAFFVLRNRNLYDVWDLNVHPNLTIVNGKTFFLDNQKLCLKKIWAFVDALGQRNITGDSDVSQTTNGDLAACEFSELKLEIDLIGSHFAYVKWENLQLNDSRHHISWVVNYRQVPDDSDITKLSMKEVCSADEWKSMDVSPDITSLFISNLRPFTKYVVYVQAYTMSSVKQGAFSSLVSFKTKMAAPSSVKNLKAESLSSSELYLTWNLPQEPNGIITHYAISWYIIEIDHAKFERRDYCIDRNRHMTFVKHHVMSPADGTATPSTSISNERCCTCPKSPKQMEFEEMQRRLEITFENFLHNSIYFKHDSHPFEGEADSVEGKDTEGGDSAEDDNGTSLSLTPVFGTTASTSAAPVTSFTELLNISDVISPFSLRGHKNSTIVAGNSSVLLTDLSHYQEYFIEVVACQEDDWDQNKTRKVCSEAAVITARTQPYDAADDIYKGNISVSVGPEETSLRWSSPQNPNALILTFEVELSRVDVENYKPDVLCVTYKEHRRQKGINIKRALSPGNWSYRIRSVSLAGNGSWTAAQYFVIHNPHLSSGDFHQWLALLVVVPLLVIIAGVLLAVIIRRKRQFDYPEFFSYNPEYINPDDLYVADGWEVNRDHVTLLEPLGQGSFGMVFRGLFRESSEDDETVAVAVKTVNDSSTLRDRLAFLHEASVMKAFDSYHVVKLLGIVSKEQPNLVIMELMSNGDLKTFLRRHRPDELEVGLQPLTLKQVLQMAGEIADGMAYLSSKKFVHRDLAARNCMVSIDQTVKIGDFGLTRDIYATEYYRKNSKGLLPVRWMAPESLKDGIFTMNSDIWSYGIVLWEMATLATQPYQGLSNEEVLHFVIDGGKMVVPDGCPKKLMQLMSMCWNSKPEKRPTFTDIIEILLPDLDENFSDISYYFSRTQEEVDPKPTEAGVQEAEEVEEENSKTPLFFPFKHPKHRTSIGQPENLPNGFIRNSDTLHHREPLLLAPESGEATDEMALSSPYPPLHWNHVRPEVECTGTDGHAKPTANLSGLFGATSNKSSSFSRALPLLSMVSDDDVGAKVSSPVPSNMLSMKP